MTIEEAKKFKEYKFFLNGVENLIDDLRKNWMENMEEDGERHIGVAVLEFGYIDIELNILTEEQVSRIPCSGNKTPVIDYFVCIKNIEWESDGYADWNVNVNWNSDNWVSQLERDMFAALEKYKDEHGYRYKGNFEVSDNIIYIPDIWLNELNVDSRATEEDIEDIIHNCYTGEDFMEECHDIESVAKRLFNTVDWQHPDIQDVLDGYTEDDDEEFTEDYGVSIKEFLN